MAIEDEKNLPVEDVAVENADSAKADELDQAELDNVAGGKR